MKKIWTLLLAAVLMLSIFVGCGDVVIDGGGGGGSEGGGGGDVEQGKSQIRLMTVGWGNTPIASFESDPFWNYLRDEYGLEVILMNYNLADFRNKISTLFADKEGPDLVSFPNFDEFKKIYDQGVLVSDWSKYLADMPRMEKVVNLNPYDFKTENPIKAKFTQDGKLTAVWALPEPVKWGWKIRQDWVVELGYEKGWYPHTDTELLEFARKVKGNTILSGPNKGKPLCDIPNTKPYCFTSAGNNINSGAFGDMVGNMFGFFNWHIKGNKVTHPLLNGTSQDAWNFMRTVVSEELIHPNWKEYSWKDCKSTALNDQVAIMNHTAAISTETYTQHADPSTHFTPEETIDWWGSMPTPKARPEGGKLASPGYCGKIFSVSKRAEVDKVKMQRICKLLNDISVNYDYSKAGTGDFYQRGPAYDKLRWGVDLEENVKMIPVPGTGFQFCHTSAPFGETPYYRHDVPGAWDWGAWFATTGDGVIDAKAAEEVTPVVKKTAEFMQEIATYPVLEQYPFLMLDAKTSVKLRDREREAEMLYVTAKGKSDAELKKQYMDFVEEWWNAGGEALFRQVCEQFQGAGYTVENSNWELNQFEYKD